MKNVKRILCMLIAIAMVFSMAACGNESTNSAINIAGDQEWDVNADVNSSDANTDSQVDPGTNNAASNVQSGATSNTQSGATSNTQSGATNTQSGATSNTQSGATNNQGTQTTPNNQATPNNQGTQSKPNNQGTQATPNNQGTQNTPATPNNQGGNNQSKPNNQGTQSTPNNQGTQSTPNNQGAQTTPNNQETQSKPNNQQTQNNASVQGPATQNVDSLSWNDLVVQMPANLRGTTVKVFSWNPIKDVTGAEKVISDFENKTGIKVDWKQGSYANYDSEIAAKINSGNSPDIIRYTTPNIARMALTQDVQSATGYDFKGSIWDSGVTSAYTVKNKIYGVNLKDTFNQQPVVVMYNKATIDRYNLDDPYDLWKDGEWNVDTFIDMCKAFTDETQRPAWMTSTQLDLLGFTNARMISFDGNQYKNNLSDKNLVDSLRECTHYRTDGIVPEAMRSHDLIENGTHLFFTDAIIGARRTDFHYSNLKADENLYCVPVPEGFSDKYYQSYYEYEAYGIPKGAKNATAVYYFLRYYLDANNYDRNMFFCNTQALETYEWCRQQKNVYYNIDSVLTKIVGNENAGLDGYMRVSGQEAQLQNEIDKVANPVVNNAVKNANKLLSNFK